MIASAFISGLVAWDLLGTVPLPLGVLGHEGSSVIVGLNGLRLMSSGAWRRATEPGYRITRAAERLWSDEAESKQFLSVNVAWQVSDYDVLVLASRPVLYLAIADPASVREPDLSGYGEGGAATPRTRISRVSVVMHDGDRASDFDGAGQYVRVASSAAVSIPTTGMLTIEAWIRPDTRRFTHQESSGYVYWLGKGRSGAQEHALRVFRHLNRVTAPAVPVSRLRLQPDRRPRLGRMRAGPSDHRSVDLD